MAWASRSGPPSLRRDGAGIGMQNVQERLEVLYGSQARFTVVSSPGRGTLVSIEIARQSARRCNGIIAHAAGSRAPYRISRRRIAHKLARAPSPGSRFLFSDHAGHEPLSWSW